MPNENPIKTLVIDNFLGSMTSFINGDINSGRSNIYESFGQDPFAKPGNLTWMEDAVQIDSEGDVITDLILAGKERVESGILYVYAIGHTGRLYKIQVNDPTTFNPDYDNPVLLATLTSGTPTFTRGAFIDFFGSTERIYISHDKGLTRIDFDGTNETAVSGTWTQNVPKPLKQFIGKLYIGNGSNIAEMDSTATITSSTKLSPGFPDNTQVRDLDTSVDGNYLHIVVSRTALVDITTGTQDTSTASNTESYIFKWNGTDTGYTAYDTFPLVSLASSTLFGNYQYTFGYDLRGVAIYAPIERVIPSGLNSSYAEAPMPNAIISDGNAVLFAAPLYFEDHLEMSVGQFGGYDWEIGTGFWAPFGLVATGDETDIVRIPYFQSVSNLGLGISSNGYPDNVFSNAKIYFSTLETSDGPTTAYRFYKWSIVPTGTAIPDGVYQTQTQLFSKKVQIKDVRVYGEPWVPDNEFTIDLIGSDGQPISGGSTTFTAGSNLTVGDDFAWYTPQCSPTYAIGARVTNTGSANHVITKIEIDYAQGGK